MPHRRSGKAEQIARSFAREDAGNTLRDVAQQHVHDAAHNVRANQNGLLRIVRRVQQPAQVVALQDVRRDLETGRNQGIVAGHLRQALQRRQLRDRAREQARGKARRGGVGPLPVLLRHALAGRVRTAALEIVFELVLEKIAQLLPHHPLLTPEYSHRLDVYGPYPFEHKVDVVGVLVRPRPLHVVEPLLARRDEVQRVRAHQESRAVHPAERRRHAHGHLRKLLVLAEQREGEVPYQRNCARRPVNQIDFVIVRRGKRAHAREGSHEGPNRVEAPLAKRLDNGPAQRPHRAGGGHQLLHGRRSFEKTRRPRSLLTVLELDELHGFQQRPRGLRADVGKEEGVERRGAPGVVEDALHQLRVRSRVRHFARGEKNAHQRVQPPVLHAREVKVGNGTGLQLHENGFHRDAPQLRSQFAILAVLDRCLARALVLVDFPRKHAFEPRPELVGESGLRGARAAHPLPLRPLLTGSAQHVHAHSDGEGRQDGRETGAASVVFAPQQRHVLVQPLDAEAVGPREQREEHIVHRLGRRQPLEAIAHDCVHAAHVHRGVLAQVPVDMDKRHARGRCAASRREGWLLLNAPRGRKKGRLERNVRAQHVERGLRTQLSEAGEGKYDYQLRGRLPPRGPVVRGRLDSQQRQSNPHASPRLRIDNETGEAILSALVGLACEGDGVLPALADAARILSVAG
eukprot:Opistho-1_new@103415